MTNTTTTQRNINAHLFTDIDNELLGHNTPKQDQALKIRTMRNLEGALYRLECLGDLTPLQEEQRKQWDKELMALYAELGIADCV